MFTQLDTNPLLQTPTALSSDDVANNHRDGQDTTYLLDLDPKATSGSFQVKLSTSGGVNMDNTPLTNDATVTITPVFLTVNGVVVGVDAAATATAIHDALSAASIVGINWPQTADNPSCGYTGTPFEGPVSVRLVPASEIAQRYRHCMGRDQRRHQPDLLGVRNHFPRRSTRYAGHHDERWPDSNTLKLAATTTDEVQKITFTPDAAHDPFSFTFNIGSFTSTAISFDPSNPNAPAAAAANMTISSTTTGMRAPRSRPCRGGPLRFQRGFRRNQFGHRPACHHGIHHAGIQRLGERRRDDQGLVGRAGGRDAQCGLRNLRLLRGHVPIQCLDRHDLVRQFRGGLE